MNIKCVVYWILINPCSHHRIVGSPKILFADFFTCSKLILPTQTWSFNKYQRPTKNIGYFTLTATFQQKKDHNKNIVKSERQHIFKPFSPNSDQHEFSPNNIHMLSREMVMRINQMITKEKMLCSFIKLPQLISSECMNISLENLHVDIGA